MYYGERLNSISHLVGAVFALIGLGALLTVSIQTGEPVVIISFSIFGFTMVLLYTLSTLYHSFHPPELKRIFKLLDHAHGIWHFFVLAGSICHFIAVIGFVR